jgi:hypothetical protein
LEWAVDDWQRREVEDRVAQLETDARLLKDRFISTDYVRAGAFTVHGTRGVVATLAAEKDGGVALRQLDGNGRTRLVATVTGEGIPRLVMTDASGNARMALSLSADGAPLVRLMDASGAPRFDAVVGPTGMPQITMFDQGRKVRLILMVGDNGTPVIARLDEDGHQIQDAD